MCQGGTLLTGAPAAESDRRGGEHSGARGALYSTGPRIGRAGSGRVRRPPSPMPRHAPRRMRELEAGLPSEEGGSEKVDTPPERASNLPGATGCNPLSFKKKCPGYLPARRGGRANACTAPQNSSQTTGTRASMQLKKEVALLCKEDAVLTSTFRRVRIGTEVAVTSTARLWRGWSPACEELSRLLASQFGWVRPVRSAQGAAREGEGC